MAAWCWPCTTRAGSAPQAQGWDSNAYALVDRHFPGLAPLARAQSAEQLTEALQLAAPQATPVQRKRWLSGLG